MGVLVDVVPNHVGIARPWENEWWWDVLTLGPGSEFASAFDIDWEISDGRVRIPVVGDDDLLPDGRIANLEVVGGELLYHDNRFPLAPGTADPGVEVDPDQVHARQHYELISWRRADTDLNYRRFFAINTLAAIRVEDGEWFARSHEQIARWFADGLVDGLRIDHPDGLREPGRYLDDLASLTGGAYVLVEKILEPGEELPGEWATAGTTGYDAMAVIDRLFVDPTAQQPLDDLEARLRGEPVDWEALVHDRKRDVADGALGSEVRRIARELAPSVAPPSSVELGETSRDHAPLVDAVAELLACFPVYRSYLPLGREHLDQAFAEARERRPDLAETLDAVAPVLHDGASQAAQRFQQTSGMVMAKGVEDCSFYRWSRLTSLNEVGGDPSVFSLGPTELHELLSYRQQHWPAAMTAGSTHDTKRGEDVRARITALSEVPELWERSLDRLLELVPVPDPGFANLLWQAVLGAWPASTDRLHAYAEKAMREASEHTTWIDPDADYEAAMHACVTAAHEDAEVRTVLEEVLAAVVPAGWSNALGSRIVTLTAPGVPDVYQGSELWEQSLVDPDNRRPVDFERREALLTQVRSGERPVPGGLDDAGGAKLLLTHLALTLRRDRPELFCGYTPLVAQGDKADHVFAFDRGGAVTVATRLSTGVAAGWGETTLTLPPGPWVDALTATAHHGQVALADLLTSYPVALLVRDDPGRRRRFDLWAPHARSVSLRVSDRTLPMVATDAGWWTVDGPEPLGEQDYGYVLDESDRVLPDPRSRRQPDGVHGLSRTFDASAYAWGDGDWTGRPLAGSVVYELHVGTFTPEGTLDSAVERLDHLRDLGVDVVELMPVNAFNGTHGWGYDGVAWSAVHEPYGGPAAYQRFVDACHQRGLAVVQDVVHNHLGPSGNYLPEFGPYLTEGENTWGSQVNLDGEGSGEVRAMILDNVRMWLEDFHLDGLRLDAIHALSDDSEVHLLEEMALEVAQLSAQQRRPLTLIAESELNDSRLVTPREGGGTGIDAQWSDDFHHALHVALTGETQGYYADFAPLSALAKVLERGFFHDGTWSTFRGGEHGRPIDVRTMPGWRLVVCSQNHDQVGNRARGDRLTESLDLDQLAAAALLTLAGPFTPMLFQGEEWGASTPFQFFTSHPEPELGEAVSLGRRREFEAMDWGDIEVPDPQDPATYQRSTLDWSEPATGEHALLLETYRRLIRLRRALPELTDPDLRHTSCVVDEDERWLLMRRGVAAPGVAAVVNLGEEEVVVDLGDEEHPWQVLWHSPAGVTLRRGQVVLPAHASCLLR